MHVAGQSFFRTARVTSKLTKHDIPRKSSRTRPETNKDTLRYASNVLPNSKSSKKKMNRLQNCKNGKWRKITRCIIILLRSRRCGRHYVSSKAVGRPTECWMTFQQTPQQHQMYDWWPSSPRRGGQWTPCDSLDVSVRTLAFTRHALSNTTMPLAVTRLKCRNSQVMAPEELGIPECVSIADRHETHC